MEYKISKRKFLMTAVAATAGAFVWEPLPSFCKATTTATLRRLDLNGSWQVSQAGKNDWMPATVPGCIHTDLLALGNIPDPFYRDNEKAVEWVAENDWIYRRNFEVPAEILKCDHISLRCNGLDTVATISINGREVGRADNMFRHWEFEVRSALQAGENVIEITFESPSSYIKKRQGDQAPYEWVKGRAWIRKEPCSFGWDWGPNLPSCGIWKGIALEAFDQARISDVFITQDLSNVNLAVLEVRVNIEPADNSKVGMRAALTLIEDGMAKADKTVEISNGKGSARFEVRDPKLWWPAGMGDQPLYQIRAVLLNADGLTIDSMNKRIGLRELKIILPNGEKPLQFEANGIPFFAKGANWIPCDSFTSRVTPNILRRYVADAAAVNINTLRFWGGGYYEDDALFDACDEMGICVWLDFKFACSAYPSFDGDFMGNVRQEAADNLRRLRHHPCIAVWCGNNEISLLNEAKEWSDNTMSRKGYDELFKQLLGEQMAKYAPQANYVSGSPDCGDTHYWDVWHGYKTFDAYRTLTGFMSEFGYQSFPELKTIIAFTNDEDRKSVLSPVMKWHQRSGVGNIDGNAEMVHMIHRYFNAPKDFETTLWLSQILQGYGIKIGAEYWRQTMPKSMGCIFWQYNDIWPGMSWSSVDYFGRWKALHYMARKFYSPILVSGIENAGNKKIDLFVTSDLLTSHYGILNWQVTNLGGNSLSRGSMNVAIPARKSQRVMTLDLQGEAESAGSNNLLAWFDVSLDGNVVSDNLATLALPKELKLADPGLCTLVEESPNGFQITVKAKKPALWVWLNLEDSDARFSDNFIHLRPNEPVKIFAHPLRPLSKNDFVKELRVRSLFDTYLPAS